MGRAEVFGKRLEDANMNQDSKTFIDWSMKQLDDPKVRKSYIDGAREILDAFEAMNPSILKEKIKEKLTIAAYEYGSPIDSIGKLDFVKEKTAECLDLIGWPLVEAFQKEYGQRDNK